MNQTVNFVNHSTPNCPIWICVELGFSWIELVSGACSLAVSLLLFLAKTSLQMSCIWLSILYVCSPIATRQDPLPFLLPVRERVKRVPRDTRVGSSSPLVAAIIFVVNTDT